MNRGFFCTLFLLPRPQRTTQRLSFFFLCTIHAFVLCFFLLTKMNENSAPPDKGEREDFSASHPTGDLRSRENSRHRACALGLSRCGAGFWPMPFFLKQRDREKKRKQAKARGRPTERQSRHARQPTKRKTLRYGQPPFSLLFSRSFEFGRWTKVLPVCTGQARGRVVVSFPFFVRIGRCTTDKLGALEKPIFFRPFQRLPFFPLACAGVFALFPSARAGQCLPIFALGCNEKRHKCLFFFKKKEATYIFLREKARKAMAPALHNQAALPEKNGGRWSRTDASGHRERLTEITISSRRRRPVPTSAPVGPKVRRATRT